MGLFSAILPGGSSSPEEARAQAVRAGSVVPSRAERKRCWESRDIFFACLDKAEIIDTVDKAGAAAATKACPTESAAFERDCAAQWVAHFKKYRIANHQKEQRLAQLRAQGAFEMQIDSGPGNMVIPKK